MFFSFFLSDIDPNAEHGGGSLWDRCAGGGRRPRGQTAHQGGPLRQGALVDLVLGRLDAWLT